LPSSRQRPVPGDGPPRRPSSRRPGPPARGVRGPEREELVSEPPEYQSSDKLDTIGLETDRGAAGVGRSPSGRRISSRRLEEEGLSASQRKKQEWAQARVRMLKPAAWGLAAAAVIGVACYVPVLIRNDRLSRLGHANPLVREDAAINLGELQSGLDQLAARVEAAQEFEKVGGAAALGLAFAKDPGFNRLKILTTSTNPVARRAAAFGLGLTGRPEAVAPLVERLADPEGLVKIQAAKALGLIRSAAAVKALLEQAQALSEVREAAADSLRTIACTDRPGQLAGLAEIRAELVKGLRAPTPQMRQAAGRTLIMLDQVPAEAELLESIESKDPAVKAGAIEFLGLIGGPIFDLTIPKALADKAAEVRAAGAAAAGLRRWAQGADALEKMAVSAEEPVEVRAAAAEALGLIGRLESVGPLAKAVVMAETKVAEPARLAAARALSAVGERNPTKSFSVSRKVDPTEANDLLTHLKLAARTPDPRWPALETLVAGCDNFGEAVGPEAFKAMNDLARRSLAAKPEVWKAWMTKKQEEAKALGQASYLYETGYPARNKRDKEARNEGFKLCCQARQIVEALRARCDPDDKEFFDAIFKLLESYKDDGTPAAAPKKPDEGIVPKFTE